MTKNMTAKVVLPVDTERVFVALTAPRDLECWFCEHAEVDLNDGVYRFWGKNTPETPTEIEPAGDLLNWERGSMLELAWDLGGRKTLLRYEVARSGDRCELTVRHGNLPERRREEDASLNDFWYTALENLRLFMVTGGSQVKPDFRSATGDEVRLSVAIDGSVDAVFRTISEPEELNRYFGRGAKVDLRVGGCFSFGWDEGGPVKILDLDPPNLLSYSWKYRGEPSTIVTWTLEGSGGGTRLTITHSGFGSDFRQDAYRAGWMSFLAMIKAMVELGRKWKAVEMSGVAHGEV